MFYEVSKIHENAKPNERIWTNELAIQYGYPSSEAMRSSFRRAKAIFGKEKKVYESKNNNSNARILCFDIESSLINAFVWGIWEQNVNIESIVQDWHLLSWSAKWLFDSEIMSDSLTSEEAKNHDDSRVCKSIWKLLDEADIVIAHNGNSFDVKRLNTRFLFNKMFPPSSYQTIDTLLVAKNVLAMTSNKMDYLNEFLGLPKKEKTSIELWIKCYYGDPDALKEMETYNRNDTDILEDLYLKLRPWIRNHPNMNLWSEENVSVCPNCGSKELNWNGKYYTYTGSYKAFRCSDCGATGRSRQLEESKEKRKSIVK
jgi:DNA-directed RNA polymerase subunit RPC12/RpoP